MEAEFEEARHGVAGGVEFQQLFRPCPGAIADPEFASVRAVVRTEEQVIVEHGEYERRRVADFLYR